MIRCVRLWSGDDGQSQFEEGAIDLTPGARGDALSDAFPIVGVSIHETDADPRLGWHTDAARQLVITLSGELAFETQDGTFQLAPGDILLTEEMSGKVIAGN
jgi:AraC-like ligand binding domain